MKMPLAQVAQVLGCEATGGGTVAGWSIDSRTVQPGDLFFALPGETHDGHLHVEEALAKGAVAAVVERPVMGAPVFRVANTLESLQRLATYARQWWAGTVIGVTGSAGKTGTKDIVAALVGVAQLTGKTVGNLNNHLGVPLSILRLPEESQCAVLEMGMNHAGEIRRLCEIAKPQIAVVTNVGYAHIENFASIDGIAAAKRELVEGLPADGVAVLNYDDARVREFPHPGKRIRFGLTDGADVCPRQVRLGSEETTFQLDGVSFRSQLTGRHSLLNLLAGLTVARELGSPLATLQDAVADLRPGKMRGERRQVGGVTILDDCYNSNPDAARAMLDLLAETPAQRRIAVLGEMRELGTWTEELHRGVGQYAAEHGVTVLLGIRGAARHLVDAGRASGLDAGAAIFFDTPEAAGEHLRQVARDGDAILFKGSRGTQVELALSRFLEGR